MTEVKLPEIKGAIVSWQYTAPLFVAVTGEGEVYITRVDSGETHVFLFDDAGSGPIDFDLQPMGVNYRCVLGSHGSPTLLDINIQTMDVHLRPLPFQMTVKRSILTDRYVVLVGDTVEVLDAITYQPIEMANLEISERLAWGELRGDILFISTSTYQFFQINLVTGDWTNLSQRGVQASQFKLWRNYLVASQAPTGKVILYNVNTWRPITTVMTAVSSPFIQADTDFAWLGTTSSVLSVLRSEGGSITKTDYEVGNSAQTLRISTAALVDLPTQIPCLNVKGCYQSELVLAHGVFV